MENNHTWKQAQTQQKKKKNKQSEKAEKEYSCYISAKAYMYKFIFGHFFHDKFKMEIFP